MPAPIEIHPNTHGALRAKVIIPIVYRKKTLYQPGDIITVRPSVDEKNYYHQTARGQIVIPKNALLVIAKAEK